MYAMRKEINQYRQAGHLAEAAVADPHRLIQMLYEGALERIAVARGAMVNGNPRIKGEQLGKAISIIEALADMLDQDKGGELASNLAALYEYMSRRLLQGSMRNDPEALTEVSRLLREIKSGWDAVPDQLRQAS
ncbi:flagellar export chaperone FliS [Thiorhodococcus mannitoliphagus]|uniref:Flagellar secretion chaperone FliS n=1 Tax=Thiorhodococcus mannitoliphagus TaxID=329406 RepID=A0A6P1E4Q2_9GAMM|nr:flagellar export chaperone FliS [Thiorhodococcus mannitoliphagus]NEX23512.1 flagellar export chaperone FliS [Thiorhodococcus mannitoliphagus]